MALKRKDLSAMGIDEDKIESIIERHTETVNGLKDELAGYKEKADKLDEVKKELAEANKKIEAYENKSTDEYKEKYESLQKEFDDYKADIDAKELKAKKTNAYRSLLKEAGVVDKRCDAIMRVTNLDDIELDGDTIKDADTITEHIKNEWADFIGTPSKQGAKIDNPPQNTGGKTTMTKEEIRAIKDPQARQKAMIENGSLFGLTED